MSSGIRQWLRTVSGSWSSRWSSSGVGEADDFEFLDPGRLVEKDIKLVLRVKMPAVPRRGLVPSYAFDMRHARTGEKVGSINLRVGDADDLRYSGHIGYSVVELHRGQRYAARSCRLLFPLAKRHGLNPLWITCNPENAASRKTCEIAGGELVEIVDLPKQDAQYKAGDRQKCRYRFDL